MEDDGSGTGPPLTLSLHQVVSTLSGPIREEHAWAVLYQGITKLHEVSTVSTCYLLRGLGDLLLTGDGRVRHDVFAVKGEVLGKVRAFNTRLTRCDNSDHTTKKNSHRAAARWLKTKCTVT